MIYITEADSLQLKKQLSLNCFLKQTRVSKKVEYCYINKKIFYDRSTRNLCQTFCGPSIFFLTLKLGLKRRKVENHWFTVPTAF